ncbi:sigma 54-interacting transcriptional regulator [Priestia filamentosa]|uniref:sigma-54 interaction domain-containing protein n=1 Tax=Priestia filamentosa TaxID=1402861 RepID=UPI003D2D077C
MNNYNNQFEKVLTMKQKDWNENELILNSLKDDLLVTNRDGIIVRASKGSGDIYNVNSEKLLGQSVYELELQGLFTPNVTSIILRDKKKVTLVQTTKQGKKLLVTGIPVKDSKGEIVRVVSYSHDITELIEVKKYLDSMEDEMGRVKTELEMLRNKHLLTEGLVAKSEKMQNVLSTAVQVSDVDVNVLLLGESGVGKSHLAKFIHNKSPRNNGAFIEVNCGAIPDHLFEAEFFGYEAGAFTGASRNGKVGLVELADRGTLFLDEIGELSLTHQVKVLKFIQEKQFYRVGGRKLRKVDCRLIAATNKDLEKGVREKEFREDLYFRLSVVPITIPPLRDRPEDIFPIITYFLQQFEKKYNRTKELDEAVTHSLLTYEWKGNIRELINMIERLVVTSPTSLVTAEHLPQSIRNQETQGIFQRADGLMLKDALEYVEKEMLLKAKKQNRTTIEMANALGISQPSVVRKLKKYNI